MGTLLGAMVGIFLVVVLLEIFVFLPLPLYLAGKVIKIQHEKFSYKSCIWTGFATGLVAGIVAQIINTVLVKVGLSQEIAKWAMIPVGIIVSFFVLGYFLKKSYLLNNIQVLKTYVLFLVFGILLNMIVFFAVSMILVGGVSSMLKNTDRPSKQGLIAPGSLETISTSSNSDSQEDKCARIDDTDSEYEFELYLRSDCVSEYKTFIEKTSDLDVLLPNGSTYLGQAVKYKELVAVEGLVEAGADVNFQNRMGQTALMWAVQFYTMRTDKKLEQDIVKFLIDSGADLSINGNSGKTVLDVATDEWKEYLGTLGLDAPVDSSTVDTNKVKR